MRKHTKITILLLLCLLTLVGCKKAKSANDIIEVNNQSVSVIDTLDRYASNYYLILDSIYASLSEPNDSLRSELLMYAAELGNSCSNNLDVARNQCEEYSDSYNALSYLKLSILQLTHLAYLIDNDIYDSNIDNLIDDAGMYHDTYLEYYEKVL